MPDYTVAFHIGAHKTASTFLKSAIQSNKKYCRDAGIKLVPYWKYRKELMPLEALIDDGGDLVRIFREFESQLDKVVGTARRAMISEENTLVLSKPFGDTELYPLAEMKFANFRNLIGDRQADIFLSVRDYSTFLPSLYGQYIRHNKYMPFDEFVSQTDLNLISWASLVERIWSELKEPDRLYVWPFEAFIQDPAPMLRAFFSTTDLAGFSLPTKAVRQGLSGQAMRAIEEHMLLSKAPWAKSVIMAAEKQFPLDQGYPKYQPFSETERTRLTKRYVDDLLELKSRGEVTFIG